MMPCHARSLWACLLSAATAMAWSATTPTAAQEHRAACVAALTARAEPLAARLKAGDHAVEPELLKLTESGFALIGTAYKDGLRKPEADQMLARARNAQQSLPSPELSKLQDDCLVEGAKVLADAGTLERFLVSSAASRRVNRIAESGKKR